ncbi:TPA: Glu-tRNA(Gln) amidotransferase subunit GatD [Candidatus Woesearchaeota archaeon]|nr:Glu-tRNA(Gln) amidotransferase subunit GatD [Candidatus Woesearchaeota archaeon]
MDIRPGDKVKVICKDDEFYDGLFIDKKKDTTVIKSVTGYNIGILNSTIKEVKLLEKGKDLKISHAKKHEPKPGLPTISILHTGGTIASKVDYRTGAVVASFNPEDLIGMFPELLDIANIDSRLIGNMFSDDMRFLHYSLMAKAIQEEVEKGAEGIILTQGTDTLGYTAAALSFMLESIPVPVLIVGAQRSSDRGSSDAAMNLLCAAEFIRKSDFAGVAVCMHELSSDDSCAIMPGCKTRKLHTSRRDAFQAVNDSPVARVNFKTRKVEMLKGGYLKKDRKRDWFPKDKMEEKVAILKIHTNMSADQFRFFKGYRGLVIEGTGLGHAPINMTEHTPMHDDNKKAIKELVDSGCVVVMTSQCLFGRTQMDVYSTGRDLQEIGVIPGEDMLPETAFIKLAWLLANEPADVKTLLRQDLRGEINPSIGKDDFLDDPSGK